MGAECQSSLRRQAQNAPYLDSRVRDCHPSTVPRCHSCADHAKILHCAFKTCDSPDEWDGCFMRHVLTVRSASPSPPIAPSRGLDSFTPCAPRACELMRTEDQTTRVKTGEGRAVDPSSRTSHRGYVAVSHKRTPHKDVSRTGIPLPSTNSLPLVSTPPPCHLPASSSGFPPSTASWRRVNCAQPRRLSSRNPFVHQHHH
jgi:hypothetical protein